LQLIEHILFLHFLSSTYVFACFGMLLNSYVDHDVAVISTLLTFVTMFRKAHEENRKQAELDKKRAEKEAEAEKSKAQLASKNDSKPSNPSRQVKQTPDTKTRAASRRGKDVG
jgi:Sec-independent protein translocase protein TatA